MGLQKGVALSIRLRAFGQGVLSAINLHDDPIFERDKINDVSTDRRLAPEMKAKWLQFT